MSDYKASDYFLIRVDEFRSGVRLYELSGPFATRQAAERDLFGAQQYLKEKVEIWSLPDLQRARREGIRVDMVGEL